MTATLANSLLIFPVFRIAGWLGYAAALAIELGVLWIYLRKAWRSLRIAEAFVVANLLSTLAGVVVFTILIIFPNQWDYYDLSTLWFGVAAAFALTVLVEYRYFRWRSRTSGIEKLKRRLLFRAVFMANFASYTVLLSLRFAMSLPW